MSGEECRMVEREPGGRCPVRGGPRPPSICSLICLFSQPITEESKERNVCSYMYMYYALGDCLTSRPKGRSRPREWWFSIYSCTTHSHSTHPLSHTHTRTHEQTHACTHTHTHTVLVRLEQLPTLLQFPPQ